MERTFHASYCRTSSGVFDADSGETANWLLTGSICRKSLPINPCSYALTQAFLSSAFELLSCAWPFRVGRSMTSSIVMTGAI